MTQDNPSAPAPVAWPEIKLPDDGSGDEDSYNAGWNACRLACLAAATPSPPAPAEAPLPYMSPAEQRAAGESLYAIFEAGQKTPAPTEPEPIAETPVKAGNWSREVPKCGDWKDDFKSRLSAESLFEPLTALAAPSPPAPAEEAGVLTDEQINEAITAQSEWIAVAGETGWTLRPLLHDFARTIERLMRVATPSEPAASPPAPTEPIAWLCLPKTGKPYISGAQIEKPDEARLALAEADGQYWTPVTAPSPPAPDEATVPGVLTDDQAAAVEFYQYNPSAAVFDLRARLAAPSPQAPAEPETEPRWVKVMRAEVAENKRFAVGSVTHMYEMAVAFYDSQAPSPPAGAALTRLPALPEPAYRDLQCEYGEVPETGAQEQVSYSAEQMQLYALAALAAQAPAGAALTEALPKCVGEMLAVLCGDGGHYLDEFGVEAACFYATQRWYAAIAAHPAPSPAAPAFDDEQFIVEICENYKPNVNATTFLRIARYTMAEYRAAIKGTTP